MAWYHRKTLIPPFNFGRNVEQDDWDKWFPKAPKRANETDEEYMKRTKEKEVYYCFNCSMAHHLPLEPSLDGPMAGFCRLCGIASTYAGHLTEKEMKEHDVSIP